MTRLNPFAFPPDTDARFVLLVVTILSLSIVVYNLIYNASLDRFIMHMEDQDRCWQEAEARYPADYRAHLQYESVCNAPMNAWRASWQVLGALVLCTAVAAAYWVAPSVILRQKRLKRLEDDAPEVVAYLNDLCREVGLRHPPVFVWNPLNPNDDAFTFGRFGQHYVALDAKLAIQYFENRAAFRAVMLHEIGHLKNQDVDKTYLSLIMVVAFLGLAIAPFVLYRISWHLAGDTFTEGTYQITGRLLFFIALIYLILCSIMRVREVYADARVSLWDGPGSFLRSRLSAPSAPHSKPSRGGWWAYWKLHPSAALRLGILEAPSGLFSLHFWEAFGAGLMMTLLVVAVPAIGALLTMLLHLPANQEFVGPLVALAVFSPLLAGMIVPMVWRATYASLQLHGVPRSTWLLGLGLGLGFMAGQYLSPVAYQLGRQEQALRGMDAVLFDLSAGAILVCGLVLACLVIAASAAAWLKVLPDGRSPGESRPYRVGLVLASGLLAAWLYRFYDGIYAVRWDTFLLEDRSWPEDMLWNTIGATTHPFVLLTLAGLIGFTIVGWSRSPRDPVDGPPDVDGTP